MPDPKKPWEKNYSEDIVETKVEAKKPWEQEYDVSESEKKKSTPTTTPQKSVLGTPTGSSGGVNPAFKSNIPSPIPDFNSMKSEKSVVQKPKFKLQKPPVKEDTSFFDYLKENLDTGLATVSKSIYDTPGFIYDAAASITNPIFRAMGVGEDKLASSDKLANDLGFKNIPSEILKEKINVSNEKINAYSAKNGGDALQAVQDGNYVGAAKLVAGTTAQSLPIMVAAMLSGGETTALSAIGLSTASTKNAQLKEENPEIGLGTRVLNATNAGIIEATTGHLFTGASGAVMKKIIADKGVEVGSKIIAKSFKSTIEKSIEKNPLVGAFGEVIEESAVEFGNQVNDMSSGIRTEFDFHAIKNAGLSATGMGGLQTLGVYGAKGYVKAKDYAKLKSTNKEVFKLRSEIENGNLSPENKAILSLRADRLEAENKKLLGTEIEKAKALPTEAKTELNALNAEFEDLKTKFDDIDDADDIPDNLKPALKEEIKLQAAKNQKRKTEILSQNDGLEVKGDFSKFEGVEPDFDLENGKISSLPLKEQNRLNKLAVEKITGGDKTVEYSKEQVSKTANEIYKNEQTPPTPEAQPQAEVPQQAEADKVETPPVEDVVATSVEKPLSSQEENFSMDNNLRKEKQLEIINKSNPAPNSHNTWVRTVDDIKEAKDVFETAFNDGEMYPDFTVDDMKESLDSGEITIHSSRPIKNGSFVTPSRMNAEEYAGGKGSKIYSKTIKINDVAWIDESEGQYAPIKETKNAKPSKANTPTNGNVPLGASNVGETGNAIKESPAKESVPSSVDGGEVKGDVEVKNIPELKTPKKETQKPTTKENEGFNMPTDYYEKFQKDYPNTLLAIEENNGLITIFEDGKSREIEGHKFFEELKKSIEKGYKGIAKVSRKAIEAESKKTTKKPPTTKEKIAERIKLSDAKIDEKSDAVKAKLDAIASKLGIKLSDEHLAHLKDIKSNGMSIDNIINIVTDIAKGLARGGIVTSEHIKEAIDAFNEHFDDKIDPKAVEERIKPKKEAEPQKPESKSNDSRREKSSSEKASDLGLTEKQYLDLGDKIKDVPETGVFKKYLSGETIQREYGDPTNDQSYDVITLKDIAQHGEDMLIQAKELFGENYVAKTLDYLQVANLNYFEKGIVYAALENLMDTNVKSDPKNKSILKQQALVYADSQANLRVGSLGINTGRLRSVYNAIKNGIDIDKLAGMVYTDKQKEAKTIIEGAVPNGENLNRASDIKENSIVDSDLDKLISDGVDKQINEIYKKLPSNRKAKADKAISALENIQKRLRTNTYDASIGLPIAILDAGITVIKNSIKAGVNISDAIEIGINHIKEKYGKKWDKEDDFRKDMHDGFGAEGIDSKERSPKEKSKANGVKETVKQALIDAGFYREIKGKNGVNKVLDWVKLVGRDASVEGLKKNVEEQLKKQEFDDAKIAEISKELELEYKRLAKDILDKATADLERRNLIKPSPNRKSDNQRLVDLYNEGLFGDNIKKYENVVNRILGFSDIDDKNYKEIKQKLFALAELYKAENEGKRVSEQSINAVSNDLNHAISNLMAVSSFKESPTRVKIASLALEYGILAQKALLGGIKTLAENVVSGDYAVMGNKATTGKYMTPELQKQSKENVKAVKNDIVENAGLYYGDTTTSLVTHSIVEDLINQKIKSKVGHVIMSAVTLRRWLDAKDSAIKVRLTDALFIKNAVTILTSKTNPNGAMTEEDAIQFVSEALTGDNFAKALVSAKAIIDDVNSKQEIKQLKDNPEAIHRFAMELVRENLMIGNKMTMAQIEDSFKAAYMSAGRSIGHEANNPISRQVNMGNAYISGQLNKAVSNKEWTKATNLMIQSLVMRTVVQPFMGGGANWTVIGAEKGVPIIGWISTAFNHSYRTPLELNSITGIKNVKESLFRENNFKESAVRNVIGTGFAVLAYVSMVGYKDDDDENYAKKFNRWLNKPENQWVRPYFNKLSPTAFSFVVAMEDEELGRYLSQLFGVGGENFNDTLKVIKSIDSSKEGATSGAIGKLVGKPFSSPFAWKAVKDTRDIYRGLAGLEPIKYSYKTNGFMNGYLQGGLLEQLGLRSDLKIDYDSPENKFNKKQEKIKIFNESPQSIKDKINANDKVKSLRQKLTEYEDYKRAKISNTPYLVKNAVKPLDLSKMDVEKVSKAIDKIKQLIEDNKKAAGEYYTEPKE